MRDFYHFYGGAKNFLPQTNSTVCIDFLLEIWSQQCQPGDYIHLCTKDASDASIPFKDRSWKEHHFKFSPDFRAELEEWFDKYSPDQYDIYFCPLPFSTARRIKNGVRGSRFLWADLDEAGVKGKWTSKTAPTYLWESSPGRFQAVWEIDSWMEPSVAENINKQLTYQLGADKGGWDLTQVLRIPGTKNHKYPTAPLIPLAKQLYSQPRAESLFHKNGNGQSTNGDSKTSGNKSSKSCVEKYWDKMPFKLRKLLTDGHPQEKGKRSEIIWYIENKLFEVGVPVIDILDLVKSSVWNKYRGRADEDTRLRVELEKILEGKLKLDNEGDKKSDRRNETNEDETDEDEPQATPDIILRVDSYHTVMSDLHSIPGWLVEGFWTRRSHGILAGEAKSFKSTLALDLAVSIASGRPFLGRFNVHTSGPVLYIQNENSAWIMKDRLEKIIYTKGLGGLVTGTEISDNLTVKFPPELPLHFVNQQGFNFSHPAYKRLVQQAVAQIRPAMVIFDPLYLMFDGDLNSAKDLNPALNWLLDLGVSNQTAVMIIHHWNKSGTSKRGGQRMLGSVALHGWIESALYIEADSSPKMMDTGEIDQVSTDPTTVTIEREFRSMGRYPKVDLSLELGAFGDPLYSVYLEKNGKSIQVQPLDEIITLLETRTEPQSIRQLAMDLGASRRKIQLWIEKLVGDNKVIVLPDKRVKLIRETIKK